MPEGPSRSRRRVVFRVAPHPVWAWAARPATTSEGWAGVVLSVGHRPVTVPELQRAVTALRRGDFACTAADLAPPPEAALDPCGASRVFSATRVAVVLAGHSGAGASTVTLAVAEAAAATGAPVLVIDAASPARSGLSGATTTEHGTEAGWACGDRGDIQLCRPVQLPRLAAIPDPPQTDRPPRLVVVDAGWPAWTLLGTHCWVTDLLGDHPVIVACRVSVHGVRQTEQLLGLLPNGGSVAVAAIGRTRWPGPVRATAGPLLSAARTHDATVAIPALRRLARDGPDRYPLPPPVRAAGAALADGLDLLDDCATATDGKDTC